MNAGIFGNERNVTNLEVEDGDQFLITIVENVLCLSIVLTWPVCVQCHADLLFSSKKSWYL
jgi:hypothetical protein